MKTIFPKQECHIPKWFVIDATNKTLGRLSTEASKLLRGKETSYYTPGINQGNFVVILNADKIVVTGKKKFQKLYYRNSQRPGSLKIETFLQLKNRIPTRIIEKAIWGMLPKNYLGRQYYRRLYVYKQGLLPYKESVQLPLEKNLLPENNNSVDFQKNWIKINL